MHCLNTWYWCCLYHKCKVAISTQVHIRQRSVTPPVVLTCNYKISWQKLGCILNGVHKRWCRFLYVVYQGTQISTTCNHRHACHISFCGSTAESIKFSYATMTQLLAHQVHVINKGFARAAPMSQITDSSANAFRCTTSRRQPPCRRIHDDQAVPCRFRVVMNMTR